MLGTFTEKEVEKNFPILFLLLQQLCNGDDSLLANIATFLNPKSRKVLRRNVTILTLRYSIPKKFHKALQRYFAFFVSLSWDLILGYPASLTLTTTHFLSLSVCVCVYVLTLRFFLSLTSLPLSR